jgi:hypothetical protein
MASILNPQRRAIEQFWPDPLPENIATAKLFMINWDAEWDEAGHRQPLYVLGISDGVGTCARVQGMDVLVLGAAPPDPGEKMRNYTPERAAKCAYAVLLCDPTEGERNKANRLVREVIKCVELLRIAEAGKYEIVFFRSDRRETYPKLA